MIPATQNSASGPLVAVRSVSEASELGKAPPGLHRCLLVSFSQQRAEMLRLAAENQAWQAIVCGGIDQFMRSLFRLRVSLTVVDLPRFSEANYPEFRNAVERVGDINDSLVAVCGYGADAAEEIWVRQAGVWVYLPEARDATGLELVFREARQAIENQQHRTDANTALAVKHEETAQSNKPPHFSRNSPGKSEELGNQELK